MVSGNPSERWEPGQNDLRTGFRTPVLLLIRCATRIDESCREAKLLRRSKRTCTLALAALADKVLGVQYLAIARLTADLAEGA